MRGVPHLSPAPEEWPDIPLVRKGLKEYGPRPLIMAGHLAGLFHPGIWAKIAAGAEIARRTGGLFIWHEHSDEPVDTLACDYPVLEPEARVGTAILKSPPQPLPISLIPPPSVEDIARFRAEVGLALSPFPEAARDFRRAMGYARRVEGASAADWLRALRRKMEGDEEEYVAVDAGELTEREEFIAFTEGIIADAKEYAKLHNRLLAEERARRKLRSGAHPWPDLRLEPDRVELPFWRVTDGVRERVWLAGGRVVATEGRPVPPSALTTRVATHTAYLRLFCCDGLVQGTGGAVYEPVVERIASEFFGAEPGPVFTASLDMGLAQDDGSGRAVETLRRRLVELDNRPERFTGGSGLEEKMALVKRLKTPGADRRALTAELRALNGRLRKEVEPQVKRTEAELEEAGRAAARNSVATHRGYPFIFFSYGDVKRSLFGETVAPQG